MSSPRVKIEAIAHDSEFYWQALVLRDELLRKPLGLEFSEDDIAAEAGQVHVVAIERGEIVGTLVLRGDGDGLVQMRQVAVSEKRQGRGIGRDLVRFAEALVWAECGDVIYLHAREPVIDFYEALGYEREGEIFEEVGIPHQKMRKVLAGGDGESSEPDSVPD